MKPTEMREMSRLEVEQQLTEREEELLNLKMQLATHQLENPLVIRQVRRDVARMKTILRENELGHLALPGGGKAVAVAEGEEG